MEKSNYKARQVGLKTQEVVSYHRSDEQPGKPLHLLIPGGLIALASLGLIIYILYRAYYEMTLDSSTGLTLSAVLVPFYIGGVFLFSYGYELYNIPRALRLTAIIVFVTLAAVVIVAVLFVLASSGKSDSSSSKSSSDSKSGDSNKRPTGAAAAAVGRAASTASHGRSSLSGGTILINDGGGTRVETREVIKEVEVIKEPMPVTCPFCSRSYVPAQNQFVCPSCGAATPKNLIEESQKASKP